MIRSLIAVPYGADLDLIGAARGLQILTAGAGWLKPRGVSPNAWEQIRRASWFAPGLVSDVPWSQVEAVRLVGITQPRHFPELMSALSKFDGEILCYAHEEPRLPFSCRYIPVRSLSLSAHVCRDLFRQQTVLEQADAMLMAAGVAEKTGSGLAAKTGQIDREAWNWLQGFSVSLRGVANTVSLGLREGQRGLLNDLLRHMEDLEVHDWPVTLSLVRSNGHVQELEPVMQTLWSSTEPAVLLAGVCMGGKTWLWARSRCDHAVLRVALATLEPKEHHRWFVAQIREGDPDRVRERLLECLQRDFQPEVRAYEIMTASPQCVDWSATVAQTLEQMQQFNLMGLPVLRDLKYAGLVTRRDLDRAVQMGLLSAPIGPYVPTNAPFVAPDAPLRVIRRFMVEHHVTKMPVVAQDVVVGIITSGKFSGKLLTLFPAPEISTPGSCV